MVCVSTFEVVLCESDALFCRVATATATATEKATEASRF